jgi:ABC-type iron transport system FetAB ATPase subunit
VFSPGDVTSPEDVTSALDAASALGQIRSMVHCAGRSQRMRVVWTRRASRGPSTPSRVS